MFTNAKPESRHLIVFIDYDGIYCCMVFFLAFTTGYVGNLCLTHNAKMFDDPVMQEAAGLGLSAVFVLGQAIGSAASYFVVESV